AANETQASNRIGAIKFLMDGVQTKRYVKTSGEMTKLQPLRIATFDQSNFCNVIVAVFIVPSCSPLQEKAVKAAMVRLARPAIYRRNKSGSCIRDIFAFRCLAANSWSCFFAQAARLRLLQRATPPESQVQSLVGDR